MNVQVTKKNSKGSEISNILYEDVLPSDVDVKKFERKMYERYINGRSDTKI